MGTAQAIYSDFLRDVVIRKVFSTTERQASGERLTDDKQVEVDAGREIDTRVPHLLRRSGKGGWSDDPERQALYANFTNVTLLDHVMSVVRGALQLAEIDLCACHTPPAQPDLERRLAVVAAVAFLHDADKMLATSRSQRLDAAGIATLTARYGIDAFFKRLNIDLSPRQVLALIDEVESSRAGQLVAVPDEYWHDCTYVRLADRMDSQFLKCTASRPGEKVGVRGALDVLAHFDALDTEALHRNWRVVEIADPHTPFLLDALQAGLSSACVDQHDMPPLVELHLDGRLLVVLPAQGSDAVILRALERVTRPLGASIRVVTSARGKIDLVDATGTLQMLRESVAEMSPRDREGLLRAGIDVLRAEQSAIDTFLGAVGMLPRTPDLATYSGRLVPLWSGLSDDAQLAIHSDAVLVNAVLACVDSPQTIRLGIPGNAAREAELCGRMAVAGVLETIPTWLEAVPPDTRSSLLAAFAAGAAHSNATWRNTLLADDGLLAVWLEGRNGRPGLNAKIDPTADRLRQAVKAHYLALLSGAFIAADESEEGRCHFTNMPTARSARIDGKTGLYGLNVSAFSGREGRPEGFRSSQSETLVSPIAQAEHRLRRLDYERAGRSADRRKVSVCVCAPTTAGLFGALAYANAGDVTEYALSDVLRAKIRPDRPVFHDEAGLNRRQRVARFEDFPTRLTSSASGEPGQLAFIAMAFMAAQRTGRPIHVFRGLPFPTPNFVAFDTLPQPIAELLGGTGFRLEQIPLCLARLRGIEAVSDATGFGQELALRLADPQTRFSAACDVLGRVERRLAGASKGDAELNRLARFASNLLGENDLVTNITDRALVAFGEAMARVQRTPLSSDGGTVAELGLRVALDTVETLERMRQAGNDSIIAGVAGELEKEVTRRGLYAGPKQRDGESLRDAIAAAATLFTEQVWHGAFTGMVPSSRNRRVALATYRFAFQREANRLRVANAEEKIADSSGGPGVTPFSVRN
jgi:hypothetical protein